MRTVVFALVAAAIVIAASWFVAHLPGQVVLHFGAYVLQASVPVAILGLLLLFVALYVLFRCAGGLLRLPGRAGRRAVLRRRRRGDDAVTRSLLALAAGDGAGARRESARARRLLGDTPQTLLLAAQAGRISGNEAEAEAAFKALAGRKDAAFLGLRGLLRQAVARGDWSTASGLAERAARQNPDAAWLRTERAQIAMHTGDWKGALALAGPDVPRGALATAAAEAEADPAQARTLGRQAFEADPGLAPAAIAYARRLREANKEGRAQEVLRRAWTTNPQPDLADFAVAPTNDPAERVRAAETLVSGVPEHPESRFLLARLWLAAGLPELARKQADAALAAGMDQRRLWLLFADIDDAEGRPEQSHESLRRAAVASPDPQWRCGACGVRHEDWQPVCPSCQAPGRIAWVAGEPERRVLVAS